MPSDDVILSLRQVAQYPPLGVVPANFSLVLQNGLGGPYYSTSAEALVATALQDAGPMSIGVGALPTDAVPAQLFTDNVCVALGATHNWNCYFSDALNAFAYRSTGVAAVYGCALDGSFVWGSAPAGVTGDPASILDYMLLGPTGELALLEGSVTLGHDPQAPMQAATAQWVSALVASNRATSVTSFMGRQGDVRLWINDIIAAGGAPAWSPFLQGTPMAATPSLRSNSERIATTAWVRANVGWSLNCLLQNHPFVFTFNGRSGDVVLTGADIEAAGATLNFAPLDSPAFTGFPSAPTAPPGTQTGQLATTAFVMNAVQESTTGVVSFNGRTGIVALMTADVVNAGGATLASPVFTGTPQAPTAAPGNDSGQIATTAFVVNALGGVTSGVSSFNGRAGAVSLTLADVTGVGGAPLASPGFNGVPTAPTAPTNTSTQQLATTAFVMTAVTAGSVVSFNGRTGAVTLTVNDLSAASGVTNPNASLTGVPVAPTASPGTNSTQLATTAFVTAAIAAAPGVTSFNTRTGAVSLSNADVIAVLPASTALPLVDGTASAGTSTAWSRGDHIHPTDTSRYSASNPSGFQTASQVASALAAYLPLSGGTLTGALNGTTGTFSGGFQAPNFQANNGLMQILRGTATNPTLFLNDGTQNRSAFFFNVSNGETTMSDIYSGAAIFLDPPGNFSYSGGTGTAIKPGGGPWTATSDARIKDVHGDYAEGISKLVRLRPVVYSYKGNDAAPLSPSPEAGLTNRSFVGLVAQEVEEVMPEMVTKRDGYVDGTRVSDLRTLDTTPLTFALINAVKELNSRVMALEARQ